ncbi:hypothetical protein BH24CHL6_BH24CHL6_16610 [soil metagenome]
MVLGSRRRSAEAATNKLIDALWELSVEDTLLLGQLWSEDGAEIRQRAWQRAKPAIERARLEDLLDRVRGEVGQWMQATPADYQGIGGLLGRETADVLIRRAAAPAVLDAVAGVLAEPDLMIEDLDALLRPWRVANEPDDEPPGGAEPA